MRIFLQTERPTTVPTETEIRSERQRAILDLLGRAPIRRQEEIVAGLARSGFEVTQSSVSRDLRELGVAKLGGRYVALAPATADASRALDEIAHYVRGVRGAGPNLAVVFTATGAAQTVGLALDRAGWPELVGTVAGDDTIFAATAGARDRTRLLHRLQTLLADASTPSPR